MHGACVCVCVCVCLVCVCLVCVWFVCVVWCVYVCSAGYASHEAFYGMWHYYHVIDSIMTLVTDQFMPDAVILISEEICNVSSGSSR